MDMLHGFMVDWQIVDGHEVEAALADGWFLTPTEAAESLKVVPPVTEVPADDAPVTRVELETKAKELGMKFDGRTTDKKLGELIAAKLAG
ncbi:hypothetical protein [Pseudorhodoferax sp. Leaf274]|uniref:hypothetical protein n=1 Tax=Pseudorhodoferax sp. Leaf274 TaxID=1736318 RepID=UPI001F39B13D|nr:hypothetical protein [Pseudorhodoferax sp. Leaf274]